MKILAILFLIGSFALADDDSNSNQTSEVTPTEMPQRRAAHRVNNRPIIGILTQEYVDRTPHQVSGIKNKTSTKKLYIQSPYVKFLEGGGARVVPIVTSRSKTYLRRMFKSVNGILFPGGVVSLRRSHYAKAGKYLYNLAVEANDNGIYFPIWAECLGLQYLLFTAGGSDRARRTKCASSWNVSQPIKFTEEAKNSRLYKNAGKSVRNILATKRVSVHFHELCVTVENFHKFNFNEQFRILSTNYDRNTSKTYASSVEGVDYPFYGLGFHPESVFEWINGYSIVYTSEAIEVEQYFARFFVDEARKNNHRFETKEEEESAIINNQVPYLDFYYFYNVKD